MLKTVAITGGGGGGNGTVTSVDVNGGTTGFTFTGGPVTSTGNITMSGSYSGNVNVAQLIGTLPPSKGGTGLTIPGTNGNVLTSNGTAWISQAAASGSNGTVTLINTDANLTGGPITTTGNIGLAANISFYSGNVSYTNSNVGTAVVNINTLNAVVNGLNAQIPVNYASTANLSVTYNNGTSGNGATLTATANGALSLDSSSPAATQRVLIKDQTANVQNGVYTVTVTGNATAAFVLTRATDYNDSSEINAGDGFYVDSGATLSNTTWVQQTAAPVTIGTTPITFIQFGATPSTAILPISKGGTSANTATQALTNLGGIGIGKAIAMAIIFGGG